MQTKLEKIGANCKATLEALADYDDVIEYFDDALDIEYRCGGDGRYRSAKVLLAWGGPTIYLDTKSSTITLEWYGEPLSIGINNEVMTLIDDYFLELFECIRA